jgi:hypothetical protein
MTHTHPEIPRSGRESLRIGARSAQKENEGSREPRVINRMKSVLARLGIRGLKPQLRKAPQLVD